MKAADYIAIELERRGVTHVFELVGGMITFLLDSIQQHTSIKIVSMHHEQAAGFAAEGYGRMKGIPGIAMATSGPGATNLLTAIGSCFFDSTPTVFITGQVNRHEQKGDRAIRQLGFQETDIVSMARPITKAAWLINDPADLPRRLHEAFALAVRGRPGPVLLDVPMDVQRAEVTALDMVPTDPVVINPRMGSYLDTLMAALAAARKPLMLVGGGIRAARCIEQLRTVADRLGIPVVHSLMGTDALPAAHPLRVGMIGSYGNRWANIALSECDLLFVLGSRLDVRQTGADTAGFKASRRIFHVDCEQGEMNNRITGCETLESELSLFLNALLTREPLPNSSGSDWHQRLRACRAEWPDTHELQNAVGINPNILMHEISAASEAAAAFVADVGQHQMWAAQSLGLNDKQRFFTSGGMGAMGFALPAGIGVCVASGGRPIVIIAGDGGFQLNIQELQTVVRNRLPLKLIVLNNHCHGMVRQFQEAYFKGRYQSTLWGYDTPNFCAVAEAYGLPAERIERPDQITAALARLWRDPMSPCLLEVLLDSSVNAYPKMAFGRPISEMEPLVKSIEMEGT